MGRRHVGRAFAVALVALAMLLAVLDGVAAAAPPELVINQPVAGSSTKNQLLPFSGTTNDPLDAIVLMIHEGGSTGSVVQTLHPTPLLETWETSPESPLKDGEYTAVVEQTSLEGTGSAEVAFTVETTAPNVTLNPLPALITSSTVTFGGNAGNEPGDVHSVTLKIYAGTTATGSPAQTIPVTAGSTWTAETGLVDGTYTAIAEQVDKAGNTGASETTTFTINTASPTVSLNPVVSPSKDTTPSFTGSASDTTTVTVKIYEGAAAEGTVLSTATAAGSGAGWTSGEASPALSSGTYTAIATQPSSIGNPAGKSNTVTFTVSTASPTVSLNSVVSPSKDTTPSFTGSASDTTTVTVKIYEGATAEGTVLSTATAAGTGGGWSSGEASPALSGGTYTAIAEQPSSLGNPAGKSNTVTFRISTASPTVSLNSVVSPSKDTTPSFTGSASDTTTVTVKIYEGAAAEGTVVSTATAAGSGGGWSSGGASPALSSGTYTAIATQPSSLGNPAGQSNTVTFVVNTSSPTVTLNQPESPSSQTKPIFTGNASDTTTVTVHVYNSENHEVTKATSAGGAYSAGNESTLSSGTYSATATQESSLGNPAGKSNTVTFVVNTASPTVTLNQPKSPSNDTTPSFSGFASDTTQVTIQIYKGTNAEGTPVASATAEGTQSNWASGEAGPPLSSGQYTAIAVQPSSLGNAPGKSNSVTFTVNTSPPTVTLNQPKSPSGNTTPSFTGSASDSESVTIHIYAGSKAEGAPVSNAGANGTGGGWSSGQASPALASGQYTAVAVQPSSLGNSPGSSSPVTFVVDTSSPTVTLNQPPSPSKVTTPPFTGGASDTTKVVVHIYDSKSAEVATATANPSGGAWSTENEQGLASGTYTAIATQESSLGNAAGVSNQVAFTVNTAAPTVTLNSPAVRSKNTTPSFTGTASDTTLVTVKVYSGANTEGTPVSTASAPGTGGGWTSGTATPPLADGQYTAVAYQPSSLGNPAGKSLPVPFTVDTKAPTVTLNQPKTPSNVTTPSFTGTGTEGPAEPSTVTVRIYAGTTATGSVLATAAAKGTGSLWESGPASPALVRGTYTATATQASSIGNSPGTSAPVTFVIETEPPKVTLNPLAKPYPKNGQPSFTGTATDTTLVTVHIYDSLTKEQVATATSATGPGPTGAWTVGPPAQLLPRGSYTAIATQPSSAGNPAGESKPITFDTSPPIVTLTPLKSPSNNTKPTFTGTASDTTPVVVHVFNSANLEVTKATATAPSGGAFTAGNESALSDGTYTATATQESSLGNPTGTSNQVTFVVDTAPPTVTVSTPPSPSNNRAPSFTGTASDTTMVTVKIWAGSKPTGSPIAIATKPAPVSGSWTSTAATPALPAVQHAYTAIATQESSIGNPTGESAPIHFEVDPAAPSVVLNTPPSRTNNATPSFTGSASDSAPITIEIFAGAKVEGKPKAVATAVATGTRGAWTSGAASPSLPDGAYTAVASQHNSVNNAEVGTSERFSFTVDTVPPHVTLTTPANGSSTTSQSQAVGGSAGTEEGDLPHVTAKLFSGTTAGGGQAPLQSITVNASGKAWSAAFGGLAPGTYTVRAEQSDSAGNVGVSATSTFLVVGPASAPAHPAPAASFAWFPSSPRVGDTVSLVSSSTDSASPITAFAWDPAGTGAFAAGGPATSTTFSAAGNHRVQLRVTDANGLSSVASELIPVSASLPLMQPFPVVRIAGAGTRAGIKLRLLSVLAAPGAQITVQCKGRACPMRFQMVKVKSHVAKAGKRPSPFVEFRRFERFLAAGVTLEIRVSKAGVMGKYTRFVVRRGKLPLRFDACLAGIGVKPVGCPSS
jgi:large repetitive protein